MKITRALFRSAVALAVACLLLAGPEARALSLNVSSRSGALLEFFSNQTFHFKDGANARDFDVTGSDGIDPSTIGLSGNIEGLFTLGSILTDVQTGEQSANVSGSGVFSIFDGSVFLTSTLVWENVSTFGTGGGFNTEGVINLSNLNYSGSNLDLLDFANSGTGFASVSFNLAGGNTLTTLSTQGGTSTYAGGVVSIPVPDGGSTLALLGGALVVLQAVRRKIISLKTRLSQKQALQSLGDEN